MKRVVLFILALLLLLSACGRAKPEVTTEVPTEIESTTEEATTTEAETTVKISTLPASGESNGVKWRTLDLRDKANAKLKEELCWRLDEAEQTEFQMGNKKIVVAYEQIEMADESGKRTTLLEIEKVDATDEMSWRYPSFDATLDNRYFLYYRMGWECCIYIGIYDTKEMKEIPIIDAVLNGELTTVKIQGDFLYFAVAWGGEDYFGEPHLYRYDWTAVKRGEPVTGVDLLEGFNGADAIFDQRLLTDSLRYYIALERLDSPNEDRLWINGLRIYDLAEKKLLTLPRPDFPADWLEEWNGKVYWTHWRDPDYALEITLP